MKPRIATRALCHLTGWLCLFSTVTVTTCAAADKADAEITQAIQIRRLSIPEATQSRDVKLRGVVLWFDPKSKLACVQDETGGVFIETGDEGLDLRAGNLVDVTGVTGPGYYHPNVRRAQITLRGESRLPTARALTAMDVSTGHWCGEWVELAGTVRNLVSNNQDIVLEITDAGGKLIRAVLASDAVLDPDRFMHARVHVRGVPRAQLNQSKQLVGVRLLVPRAEDVIVIEPAPVDAFALPHISIGALGRYSPETSDLGRRVRVRGTATYQRAGHSIFLHDKTGDVLVQTRQSMTVKPGDVLDVVGYQEVLRRRIVLNNASFRKVADGTPPEPQMVEVEDAWTGRCDTQLICLRATVVERLDHTREQRLSLRSGKFVFNADFPENYDGPRLDIREGSEVQVAGIWLQQSDISDTAQSYRLLLRSDADVTVLNAPSWWTKSRLLWAAAGLLASIATSGFWVFALKRRVTEQTGRIVRQLAAQTEVERRCRDLVDKAHDFVFTVDATGRFLSVNPAGERITGYRAAELLKLKFSELLAPEARDVVRQLLAAPEQAGGELPHETAIRAQDGRRITLEVSVQIQSEAGHVTVAQCIARDVTDRSRIETELRNSQQRLGLLIQESPLGVIVWDENFCVREWNRAAERMFGFPEAEAIGRNADLIVLPAQRQHVAEVWRRLLLRQGGFRSTNENCTKDGRTIICSWYNAPLVDSAGCVTGVASLVEDVTDRKRAEEKLQLSESLYRNLVETSSDLIWSVDLAGCVTFANERALKLIYGYSPAEFVGHLFAEFVSPEQAEHTRDIFKRVLAGELVLQAETTTVRRDGQPVYLNLNAIPVRDEAGRIIGATGTATDISRRRELEAQLRHAQKMDAVGQLAAGVAHDFNNLLTVIQGRAGLLMIRAAQDDGSVESIKEITGAAERGTRLIRQLLTFSRKNVLATQSIDLNEVIRQVSKMLQRLLGEDIALDFGLSRAPARVFADVGMVEQVLVNLCVNARDAMPKGGRVLIGSVVINIESVHPQANPDRRPGKFVCLTVSDTGCGMDSETLGHIFEPFFTTKEVGKGTGLGLSMVYGIIKQHHGWVEVESAVRQGTTFRLYLPCHGKPEEAPKEAAPTEPAHGGRETILVVEDEPAVRRLVCGILQGYGYRILSAPNGQAALRLWKDHVHEVDLLLTDMVMPEGVSGGELADRLTAEKPSLKVICCSGYSADIVGRRFKTRDTLIFMEKPYNPGELARKVRETLDAAS